MLGRFLNQGRNFVRPAMQFGQQRRNMILGGGKPISLRQDSLLVACCISAITYFVPQDLVFLGLVWANLRSNSGQINNKQTVPNAEAAFNTWKEKRGINNVALQGSGSTYYAVYTAK